MVEQRQKVDAFVSSAAGPLDVTLVAPLPVPVTIPTPVEVCGEGGAGDPVLVEGIVGGVPVPVTIPTPVEVCGEGGAGDPVLVEGIVGGVPVPVSVAPGAPVTDAQDVTYPPAPPGHYMLAWYIDAATVNPGRVIFQVFNKAYLGVGYGIQPVNFYVDVMLLGGLLDANIPLYGAWPAVPTLTIPADSEATFEVDSFLSGVKLDLSQVKLIIVNFICPDENKFYASVRCNGDCTITWDGTVY